MINLRGHKLIIIGRVSYTNERMTIVSDVSFIEQTRGNFSPRNGDMVMVVAEIVIKSVDVPGIFINIISGEILEYQQ